MKVMQFKVETGQKVLDLKVIVSVYISSSMSVEKVSITPTQTFVITGVHAGSQRGRCRDVSSPESGRSLCHRQC